MLPHVDLEERDSTDRNVALLVEELEDDEPASHGVVGEHRPARALDAQRCGGEMLLERLEGAEGVPDRLRQLALGFAAAVRGEVLPEDRVVDVTAEVEGEVLLPQVHRGEVIGGAGGPELVQGGVGAGDVGGVVLVVVELHDPPGDVGLEGCVVVGKLGKCVQGHGACLSSVGSRVGCDRFHKRFHS